LAPPPAPPPNISSPISSLSPLLSFYNASTCYLASAASALYLCFFFSCSRALALSSFNSDLSLSFSSSTVSFYLSLLRRDMSWR
jgi:hypothetical protein